MVREHELLIELTRLNRQGVINDEEFIVLRRLILEQKPTGQTVDEFLRLFRPPVSGGDDAV